jgi:hypothetical protein
MKAKKLLKDAKSYLERGFEETAQTLTLMSIAASLAEIAGKMDCCDADATYFINLAGKTALEVMDSEDE